MSVAATRLSEAEAQDVRTRQALAQLKSGDPGGALETLAQAAPSTTAALISRALTLSGAAAVGYCDPTEAHDAASEARRLALETGDSGAILEASWAQSLAAHARGDLPAQLRAELAATRELPDLATRVFDAHLCATERMLYGARPYDEVIAFATSLAEEAERIGAARGLAFAVTLRGEAELLAGSLDEAQRSLDEGARLHGRLGATAGQALSLQRRAEVALHRGHREEAAALLDHALTVARDSYLCHHLLDRIYGCRIAVADDPADSLARVEEAEHAVRGPLESCPACRITLVVPAAIGAARAGDLERATRHAATAEQLAEVIVPLPAWRAAVEEVRGHLALAGADPPTAAERFGAAAEAYRLAGQPLDEARCRALRG